MPKTWVKNLSNKYGQKFLNNDIKSTTDAIKTTLKRAIQTTGKATGDDDANNETKVAKKDTYLQKKDNKLLIN